MATSKHSGYQARKSRQPEPPVVKFRSSCDLCLDAKVRCEKQHPQCGRCVRIDGACHYSVSMRTGKPTIDLIKAQNANILMPSHHHTQTTDHAAGPSLGSNQSFQAILQPRGQSRLLGSTTKSPTPPTSNPGPAPQDRNPGPGLESRVTVSSSPPSMPTTNNRDPQFDQSKASSCYSSIDAMAFIDYFNTSTEDLALLGAEYQTPSGFSLSVPQTTDFDCSPEIPSLSNAGETDNDTALSPENLALKQPQDPLNGHSCVRVLKMLQASIDGEPTLREHNILSSTPPITTADQALLTCSSVSKQLIEILECLCEADAYLPFRIAVMISKVLATYSAIAKVDDLTPFSFCSISKIQQEQGQVQADFMAAPLRLGAYEVDRELEGTLRAQLVFHELSKFEPVVKLFADKYCQNGVETQDEDGAIYSALGQFIRHRFVTTKTACELRSLLSTQRIQLEG